MYDAYTGFHLVSTGISKTIVNSSLIEFLNIIERLVGHTISNIVIDGEKTFDSKTRQHLHQKGIMISVTAPETPEQDGPGERSGQTFVIIDRSFRIMAQLPSILWPEMIKARGYIANRTPIQRHNYKTPYELAFKRQPRLHHIRIIGSMAQRSTEANTETCSARTDRISGRIFRINNFPHMDTTSESSHSL